MAASDAPSGDGPILKEAREDLSREGRRIAVEIKDDARRFADEKKEAAAGVLRDVSEAVATASEEIRRKGHERAAAYADYAAREVGWLAQELQRQELGELIRGVESFARRRPGLFAGASLLAGFAAVRFLKSRDDEARRA
ncbi:MAG TPA: hypothetical protein VF274_06370 [Alphaproteobacteria bacterium]|jgi:hypothetical protein